MKHTDLSAKDHIPWSFFIIFSICICLFTPSLFSQNYLTKISDNTSASPHLRLNEISPAAYRHFRNNFQSVSNETWVKDNNFFIASFTKSAVKEQVYYTLKGDFEYEMKCYSPQLLKKELSAAIQERFEGYSIKTVMEITSSDSVVYFIKIVNSFSIKTLRCLDGSINVIEDYINAGI